MKRFLSRIEGSFTIEASILFPLTIILSILSFLIMIHYYYFFKTGMDAHELAQKTSFYWSNSSHDLHSGYLSGWQYDSLYWRTFQNSSTEILAGEERASLPARKLMKTATYANQQAGTLSFKNQWIKQSIRITLPPTSNDSLGWIYFKQKPSSVAWIHEPAEFIRQIDLGITYFPYIAERTGLNKIWEKFHNERQNSPDPLKDLSFSGHAEAVPYVRSLTMGKRSSMPTSDVGYWRVIDSLDQNQIAHQVYVGKKSKTKDLTYQLEKDAELIRSGELNGVVWHFFRRKRDESIGLTAPLRKALEENGIVVVIHD